MVIVMILIGTQYTQTRVILGLVQTTVHLEENMIDMIGMKEIEIFTENAQDTKENVKGIENMIGLEKGKENARESESVNVKGKENASATDMVTDTEIVGIVQNTGLLKETEIADIMIDHQDMKIDTKTDTRKEDHQ